MAKYRRYSELEGENYDLKRKIKHLRARNTLLEGERDAARTLVQKFNLESELGKWKEEREIVKRRKPLYANSDMNRRKDSPN